MKTKMSSVKWSWCLFESAAPAYHAPPEKSSDFAAPALSTALCVSLRRLERVWEQEWWYRRAGIAGHKSAAAPSTVKTRQLISNGQDDARQTPKSPDNRVGWPAGGDVKYVMTRKWFIGVDYLTTISGHTNVSGFSVPQGTVISSAGVTASQNVA
jgi:hypothetical protein